MAKQAMASLRETNHRKYQNRSLLQRLGQSMGRVVKGGNGPLLSRSSRKRQGSLQRGGSNSESLSSHQKSSQWLATTTTSSGHSDMLENNLITISPRDEDGRLAIYPQVYASNASSLSRSSQLETASIASCDVTMSTAELSTASSPGGERSAARRRKREIEALMELRKRASLLSPRLVRPGDLDTYLEKKRNGGCQSDNDESGDMTAPVVTLKEYCAQEEKGGPIRKDKAKVASAEVLVNASMQSEPRSRTTPQDAALKVKTSTASNKQPIADKSMRRLLPTEKQFPLMSVKQRDRSRLGLCPECGARTHILRRCLYGVRLEPLIIPGEVFEGKCLRPHRPHHNQINDTATK